MPLRRGEKYDAILEAALKVFAEVGFHRAQVSRIAREAGVADGTVYLYFKNKEDILISLFSEMMGLFVSRVERFVNEAEGFPEKLRALIAAHLRVLGQDVNRAIVTQIELRQPDASIRLGISEPLRQYFRVIERIVMEGQKEGSVSAAIDPRVARKVIFGAIDEAVTCWVLSDRKYELESLIDPIFVILSGGLVQRK
ncbi:MAG: TetR/AcrR family transcriptional regulator [Clostridia bacterium]|nr:TetR/AcrR family transcriptional regulator [Clostridia bacterium]